MGSFNGTRGPASKLPLIRIPGHSARGSTSRLQSASLHSGLRVVETRKVTTWLIDCLVAPGQGGCSEHLIDLLCSWLYVSH